jgi:hypothetical protein
MTAMAADAGGFVPRRLLLPLLYLWALPNTLLGLAFVPLALATGGRVRVVRGCVEVHGGFVAWFLRRGLPVLGPAAAMTLGHVILGRDRDCLETSRDHEHVHVCQYERWGPAMLPAYFLGAFRAWRWGLDPYLDNPFEREAFDRAG